MIEIGLLMVGWRIGSSNINDEWKYPIILPEKIQISKIIVLWCHKKTEQSRRGMALKEIRNSGYWIIANSITRAFIVNVLDIEASEDTLIIHLAYLH